MGLFELIAGQNLALTPDCYPLNSVPVKNTEAKNSPLALHEPKPATCQQDKPTPANSTKPDAAMARRKKHKATTRCVCEPANLHKGMRQALHVPTWHKTILAAGKRTEFSAGIAESKRKRELNYFASLGKTCKPQPTTTRNYATEMTKLMKAHNACFSRAADGGVGWRGEAPERTGSICYVRGSRVERYSASVISTQFECVSFELVKEDYTAIEYQVLSIKVQIMQKAEARNLATTNFRNLCSPFKSALFLNGNC